MSIESSAPSLTADPSLDQLAHTASQWQKAWFDIREGVVNWRIWLLMSWQDIRLRYRRSYLGPFWITISMAVTIYTMGFLYGHLFRLGIRNYFPFLAAGMLTWYLIASLITDGADSFIAAENYLKQVKLPYSIFIFRVVCRALIIFMHNIVVIIPVIIFFHVKVNFYDLAVIPGLLIISINAIAFGTLLAMIGARFRDVTQIINSFVQVAFFLTPIIWNPSILPKKYHFAVAMNPFAQFVNLLREPLSGMPISSYTLAFTLSITVVGLLLAFLVFAKYRLRIIYWL